MLMLTLFFFLWNIEINLIIKNFRVNVNLGTLILKLEFSF